MANSKLFDPKELAFLLKKASNEPLSFAFGLGASPEQSVLVLHRKFAGKKLLKEIRNENKDIAKGTFGQASTDGKVLELRLEKDLPGAKAHVKKYLAKAGVKQKKLRLLDVDGNEIIEDGDEAEARNGDDAAHQAGEALKGQIAKIRKAVQVWDRTTDVAAAELQKLQKAIRGLKSPLADAVARGLDQALARLDRMDDEAEAALAAAESGDEKAFEKARRDLLAKIDRLTQFVSGDEMLRDADENPITKTKIRATLSASLSQLAKSMQRAA